MRKTTTHALFAAAGLVLGLGSACYSAEFDPDADELYTCSSDSDCADGFSCIDGLCLLDEGPALTVLGPEPLQDFNANAASIPVSVRASGLTLVEPGATDDGGSGYIEIYLDGEALPDNPITSGNIASGVQVMADAADLGPGGHRVEIRTFRPDGTRYENPSATGTQAFFIHNTVFNEETMMNEEFPLVVITRPWPGEVVDGDEDLIIEVSTLEWDWIDSSQDNEGEPRGHAHLYFDIPDYPACQPECNLLYRESMNPTSSEVVNDSTLRNSIGLREDEVANGGVDIAVSLHNSDHTVFPRQPEPDTPDDPVFGLIASDSLSIVIE